MANEGEARLVEPCRWAADAVRSGNSGFGEIRVFSKREAADIERIMAARFPEIPYEVTWTAPWPGRRFHRPARG